MTTQYFLRKQAEDDLELIWSYSYQTWGFEQADKYLNSLLHRFQWLSENPFAGKNRGYITPDCYRGWLHPSPLVGEGGSMYIL